MYEKVEANNGEVLGSRKLGFGVKLLLNSAETLRPYINKLFGTKLLKSGKAGFNMAKCRPRGAGAASDVRQEYCPFFTIEFKF